MINPLIWFYDVLTLFFQNNRFVAFLIPIFCLSAVVVAVFCLKELVFHVRSD